MWPGFLMNKYQFRAKTMSLCCAVTTFVAVLCYFAMAFISCPTLLIQGFNSVAAGQEDLLPYSPCNTRCQCESVDYHPVCSR